MFNLTRRPVVICHISMFGLASTSTWEWSRRRKGEKTTDRATQHVGCGSELWKHMAQDGRSNRSHQCGFKETETTNLSLGTKSCSKRQGGNKYRGHIASCVFDNPLINMQGGAQQWEWRGLRGSEANMEVGTAHPSDHPIPTSSGQGARHFSPDCQPPLHRLGIVQLLPWRCGSELPMCKRSADFGAGSGRQTAQCRSRQ